MHPSINLTAIRAQARMGAEAQSKGAYGVAASYYREAARQANDWHWASIAIEYADAAGRCLRWHNQESDGSHG